MTAHGRAGRDRRNAQGPGSRMTGGVMVGVATVLFLGLLGCGSGSAAAVDDGGLLSDGGLDGAVPDGEATDGTTTGDATPEDAAPPPPDFVTFLGGSGLEQARDVAVDSLGNIVVVGGTSSTDFPTTAGAYDTTFDNGPGGLMGTAGPMDVFVAKLSPDGSLLWSTLVGGPSYDRAYAVEVDAAGEVYVAGTAGSGFPTTTGVAQEAFAGDDDPNNLFGPQDGFVLRLSADGTTLRWSTYFGSGGHDYVRDLDIDSSGGVYLGVADVERVFPHVTDGAYQTTRPGSADTVVAKLTNNGTEVAYATYLGGSNDEGVSSLRVDPTGAVYLAGTTKSTNLPVTPGAFQGSLGGGWDFFLARLSPTGDALWSCTYLGGEGLERAETHHLALDPAGPVVVAFETSSSDLQAPADAAQPHQRGPSDAFVAKLSADGTTLLAATFLGGGGADGAQGVAVTPGGEILIGGSTSSFDFPTTTGAFQESPGGATDAWAARLSSDLTEAVYVTYLGALDDDQQHALWTNPSGGIVSVGQTVSAAFPVSDNALQATFGGGGGDAYVARVAAP